MFGLYRVERLIGKGGMGSVYAAIHTQIQRRAAIKALDSSLSRNPTLVTRFLNEARAVNIVSHPSLVNVYEYGQLEDGTPYFVMEYLEGETLHARLRSLGGKGMDPVEAMQVVRQIASGLAAAHEKGIIHRDLKPANIMLVPDPETPSGERVKILDFGIAKILETDTDEQRLTNTDSLLGTPTYMSPEQCRSAREATDRSDVYSLGAIAYELLTGTQPFRGRSDIETIMRHRTLVPPPCRERQPDLPIEFDALVSRMLSKTHSERPTAAELKQAISRILRTNSLISVPSSSSLPILSGTAGGAAADKAVDTPPQIAKPENLPAEDPGPETLVTPQKITEDPTLVPQSSADPSASLSNKNTLRIYIVVALLAIVFLVAAIVVASR
jgi:serine/threonine-protein kinase